MQQRRKEGGEQCHSTGQKKISLKYIIRVEKVQSINTFSGTWSLSLWGKRSGIVCHMHRIGRQNEWECCGGSKGAQPRVQNGREFPFLDLLEDGLKPCLQLRQFLRRKVLQFPVGRQHRHQPEGTVAKKGGEHGNCNI